MEASYHRHILYFKKPSGTSRGILTQKESWFIIIRDNGKTGIGECGLLKGLSIDDRPDYEEKLQWVCENIENGAEALWESVRDFPSIQFGIEMAFLSLKANHPLLLFPSAFTEGKSPIDINGLVWMGSVDEMKQQITEKIGSGFHCVKLKIGAIDFDKEIQLLASIRDSFTEEQIEIRVDANGAFTSDSTLYKLRQLSEFKIHSIEQPIQKGQHDNMAELCKTSPIPIALDEELIGITDPEDMEALLHRIKPQYIILKPSLVGGFRGCTEWIAVAEKYHIGWWITSALESNIGLNAIAQWTFKWGNPMPQGLGTGALYTNNFDCPLVVNEGKLWYHPEHGWNVPWML